MKKLPKYVIVMKIGPFCNFSLDEIIAIKQGEQDKIGKFFLGYSGVFCHPKRVKEFIAQARLEGHNPVILFTKTPSNFNSPIERLTEYSTDTIDWKPLGKEVLLVGSKFSFVGKDLKPVDLEVDLSQYSSMLGTIQGKTLDLYLRFRCDKSCAIHTPNSELKPRIAKISYICELADEGCVYVK